MNVSIAHYMSHNDSESFKMSGLGCHFSHAGLKPEAHPSDHKIFIGVVDLLS